MPKTDPAETSAPLGEAPSEGDLDAHLRHADPDRWLAARMVADPKARGALLALYALNDELARVASSVTQPMLGEMRFAWWREAVAEAADGKVRAHPVVQAVAPALQAGAIAVEDVAQIIEARHLDLEPEPFPDEAALVAYIDATAGALMRSAVVLLDPGAPPACIRSAARAWGWAGLMRAGEAWRARGRRWTPLAWGETVPDDTAAERARTHAKAALDAARAELKPLPVSSFPAVAYVRFARDYVHGRTPGDIARRAELLWASTLGRI